MKFYNFFFCLILLHECSIFFFSFKLTIKSFLFWHFDNLTSKNVSHLFDYEFKNIWIVWQLGCCYYKWHVEITFSHRYQELQFNHFSPLLIDDCESVYFLSFSFQSKLRITFHCDSVIFFSCVFVCGLKNYKKNRANRKKKEQKCMHFILNLIIIFFCLRVNYSAYWWSESMCSSSWLWKMKKKIGKINGKSSKNKFFFQQKEN